MFFLLVNGIDTTLIFFSKLFIDIFLVNTLKLELEGSNAIVVDLGFFKELYNEYKPILAPISQKIKFSFFSKLSLHSRVSGSFVKKVSTLQLIS